MLLSVGFTACGCTDILPINAMEPTPSQFTPEELRQWQAGLAQANHNNIFCHCRDCDREWVASSEDVPCVCGSRRVEYIPCWQFPDG